MRWLPLLLVVLLAAACGGGSGSVENGTPTATGGNEPASAPICSPEWRPGWQRLADQIKAHHTPAVIGKGASAISAGTHATDDHLALTERVLASTGLVVRAPEKDL